MKRLILTLLLPLMLAAQTARYPSAIATTTDLTDLADRAQTTLSAALNSSATSFTVVSGSKFVAHMILTIDSEEIKICSVVGNTVSVGHSACPNVDGRGFAGTVAASHTNGTLVSNYIVAYQFKALREEIKAIETALGINMANAVVNPLPVDRGGTGAQDAATARTNLGAAKSGANSDLTSLTGLTTPLSVPQGGTGTGSVTGVLLGSGTGALAGVTGTARQELRVKPNQTATIYEFATPLTVDSADYNFPAQTPGGSLIALGVGQSITLTPCPLGLNGTDTGHYIMLTGGTGATEATLIRGGTCTAGASTGTISVTPSNAHSGAWTVASATVGIQEAMQAAGANSRVSLSSGAYTLWGTIIPPFSNMALVGDGYATTSLTAGAASNLDQMITITGLTSILVTGIKFDGNYINQTTGTGNLMAIGLGSSAIQIKGNAFTHSGIGSPGNSVAFGLLVDRANDLLIEGNLFYSNWGYDIAFQSVVSGTLYNGYQILNNQFGLPYVTQSRSNTNYWDTNSAGRYAILANGYNNMVVAGNRVYGGVKKTFLGNPIMIANGQNIVINGNTVEGMGNGTGTIAVTNGSGAVVGTNTFFDTSVPSAGDVGAAMQIEGDATAYRITAVAGANNVTITPVVTHATASGLRYQISSVGDSIACGGCRNVSITNNTIRNSHDNGIDAGADGLFGTLNPGVNYAVTGNSVYSSGISGIYIGGLLNSTVSGNSFINNGQAGAAAPISLRAGIYVDNSSSALQVNGTYIGGNQVGDIQGVHTQQYGLAIAGTTGQYNQLGANLYYGNGTADYLTPSTSAFATSFTSLAALNNLKSPAVSPMFIYGPDVEPASSIGNFAVAGGDLAHSVNFGYSTSNGYGWMQSVNQGVASTPLRLNPNGAPVGLGKTGAYAGLSACGAAQEGYVNPVSDSNTATWGAAVAGGGANHVLAYCNGTAWTVMAK